MFPRRLAALSVFVTLFLFLSLACVGCSDDDPILPEDECVEAKDSPPPSGPPFPRSPDHLASGMRFIYETMDFQGFLNLVHPDYLMYLLPSTREEFPDVGPTLDREDELIIAERMFSGEPVTNSQGDLVPGISAISFQIFEQQGAWDVSDSTDVFPNTAFGFFEVSLLFDRQPNSTLKIDGLLKIYVTSRDSVVCGETLPYYQLAGMVDLTDSGQATKAVEGVSFGSVKALFK